MKKKSSRKAKPSKVVKETPYDITLFVLSDVRELIESIARGYWNMGKTLYSVMISEEQHMVLRRGLALSMGRDIYDGRTREGKFYRDETIKIKKCETEVGTVKIVISPNKNEKKESK